MAQNTKTMVNSFGEEVKVSTQTSRQNSEEAKKDKAKRIKKLVKKAKEESMMQDYIFTTTQEKLHDSDLPKPKKLDRQNTHVSTHDVNGRTSVEFLAPPETVDLVNKDTEKSPRSSRLGTDTPLTTILKKQASQESLQQRQQKQEFKYKGPENNASRKFRQMKADVKSLLQTNIDNREYFKPWADKVNSRQNKQLKTLQEAVQPPTTRESMIPTLSGPGFMMIPYATSPHQKVKKSPKRMKTLESSLAELPPPPMPLKHPHGTLDTTKYSQGIFKTRPAMNDSQLTGGKSSERLDTDTDYYLTETDRANKIKHYQIVKQLQQRNQTQNKTLDFKRQSRKFGDSNNQFSQQHTQSKTGLLPILERGQVQVGATFNQLMNGISTPERKKLVQQTVSLNLSGSEESLGIHTYIEDSDEKEPMFEPKKERYKDTTKILVNDQYSINPQDPKLQGMLGKKHKRKANASTSLQYQQEFIPQTFSIDDLQKYSKNDIQQLLLEDLTSQRMGSELRGGKLSPSVSQVTLDASAQVTQFINLNQRRNIDKILPESHVYSPSASTKGLLVYPKTNRTPRKKIDKVYGSKQQTHEESRINSLVDRKHSLQQKRTSFAGNQPIVSGNLVITSGVNQQFESPRDAMPSLSLYSAMGNQQRQEELSVNRIKKRRLGQIATGRQKGMAVSNLTNKYY